ncbi:RNA-binding protein, putative [Medicago truncatula]|nr:RNA-binding protein, putative [Medicago truncatula]
MSGSASDETTNVDTEGRPQRLGLGAKVPRQSNVVLSDDPVERRLHSRLAAEKRKAANITKDEGTNSCGVLDDEDNEDESRTNAFAKRKAPAPVTLSIPGNKKQK